MGEPKEWKDWVNAGTGLTMCDQSLAFKYLLKGLGLHKIEGEDLQWGWAWAEVKVFIPLGRLFDLEKEGQLWDENHEDWEEAGSTESREEYVARLHQRNLEAYDNIWVDVFLFQADPRDKSICGRSCQYEFRVSVSGHGGTAISQAAAGETEKEEEGD